MKKVRVTATKAVVRPFTSARTNVLRHTFRANVARPEVHEDDAAVRRTSAVVAMASEGSGYTRAR